MDIFSVPVVKEASEAWTTTASVCQPQIASLDIGNLVQITDHLRDESVMFCEVIKVSYNNAWVYLKGYREGKYTNGLPSLATGLFEILCKILQNRFEEITEMDFFNKKNDTKQQVRENIKIDLG